MAKLLQAVINVAFVSPSGGSAAATPANRTPFQTPTPQTADHTPDQSSDQVLVLRQFRQLERSDIYANALHHLVANSW